jgi:hypothetical protein
MQHARVAAWALALLEQSVSSQREYDRAAYVLTQIALRRTNGITIPIAHQTLADRWHSVSTVRRGLADLERLGLVVAHHQWKAKNQQLSNRYAYAYDPDTPLDPCRCHRCSARTASRSPAGRLVTPADTPVRPQQQPGDRQSRERVELIVEHRRWQGLKPYTDEEIREVLKLQEYTGLNFPTLQTLRSFADARREKETRTG